MFLLPPEPFSKVLRTTVNRFTGKFGSLQGARPWLSNSYRTIVLLRLKTERNERENSLVAEENTIFQPQQESKKLRAVMAPTRGLEFSILQDKNELFSGDGERETFLETLDPLHPAPSGMVASPLSGSQKAQKNVSNQTLLLRLCTNNLHCLNS